MDKNVKHTGVLKKQDLQTTPNCEMVFPQDLLFFLRIDRCIEVYFNPLFTEY